MRFIKKTVDPDTQRRTYLMRKLAEVNDKKELPQYIKAQLRREIAKCDGYTMFYIEHRGMMVYVGDETMKRKRLLMYRDPMLWQPLIRNARELARQMKVNLTRRGLVGLNEYWAYEKVGGVFVKGQTFANKDRDIRRRYVYKTKKPKDTDSYIGLEMEFASKCEPEYLIERIVNAKLHKEVRIVNDTSILTTKEYQHRAELCVLTRYSELDTMLGRLKPIINAELVNANESCGLHVHLDVRNDDVKRVYRNLSCMQALLFHLVSPSRLQNNFCRPVIGIDFGGEDDRDHYAAISKSSYDEHRTVEVRIHQSTMDLDAVSKWVHLLKRIADYRGTLENFSQITSPKHLFLEQLKEKIKPGADILKYVEEKLAV